MSDKKEEEVDIFKKLFGNIESSAEVESYNNDRFAGFSTSFTVKDFGFGSMTFSYDKENNTLKADTECMSEETVAKILILAAPSLAKLMVKLDKGFG